MTEELTYRASCHCGAVRFSFKSKTITEGRRCNCSICMRKGIVMSAVYLPPECIEQLEGMTSLSLYQFGDKDVNHYFCYTCGICLFEISNRDPRRPFALRALMPAVERAGRRHLSHPIRRTGHRHALLSLAY